MKRYLNILLAEILFTVTIVVMLIPNEVICGGLSGLAMVLARPFGLETQTLIYVLYLLCLLACLLFLGKEFFFGTLFGAGSYLILVALVTKLDIALYCHWIPCVLLCGVVAGLSNCVCIRNRATSMGFDIVGLIARKRFPCWDIATSTYVCNALVLLLGLASYGLDSVFHGIVFAAIQALTLHMALKWTEKRAAARA